MIRLTDWLGWLMVCLLVGWLVGWLIRLTDWLDWLIVVWLVGLVGWLIG